MVLNNSTRQILTRTPTLWFFISASRILLLTPVCNGRTRHSMQFNRPKVPWINWTRKRWPPISSRVVPFYSGNNICNLFFFSPNKWNIFNTGSRFELFFFYQIYIYYSVVKFIKKLFTIVLIAVYEKALRSEIPSRDGWLSILFEIKLNLKYVYENNLQLSSTNSIENWTSWFYKKKKKSSDIKTLDWYK